MPYPFDTKLWPDFDSVKDDNEEILWSDKPKFIPYAATALSLGFGIFIFFGLYYAVTRNIQSEDKTFKSFSMWFIAIPIALFLLGFLNKIFSYSNTTYAFTNKRIMIKSGFIGTNFKSIDYDKVSDIQITVNFIERIFNVGTIKFHSGRTESNEGITTKTYDRWESIPHPYQVFKQLKTISVDIKTDFNYPNALRPDINPGYNTKYQPPKRES